MVYNQKLNALKKQLFLFMLTISLFMHACMRKQEFPTWSNNILSPIAHSNIGIKSLVTDTVVKPSSDSSYIIATKIPLSEIRFDTLIKFSEIPFDRNYTLQTLKLAPQSVTQKFSLGDILTPTPYSFINSYHGAMLPSFFADLLPATVTQGPLGPYYFNANNFFKSATLISGDLDLSITNNLPIDIQSLHVQFKNKISGTIIFERTNIDITSGSTKSFYEDLSGKTIEGDLEAIIPTITIVTNGLKTQPIDTSRALSFKMTISNVKVSQATAVFPQQDVIDEDAIIGFQNMGKYEIKQAVLRSGEVQIDVTSTAQDTLYFDYKIPSLTSAGSQFSTSEKVNPGSVLDPAVYTKSFNFTDYNFDLTSSMVNPLRHPGANTDTFNTINSVLMGRIRYSGKLIYLSLQDSLSVHLKMKNLVAASAKGYLGDTLITVSGETTIQSFKKFASSTFALEKASVKLNIANGVGINGQLSIIEFKAINSSTNQTLTLTGNAATALYPIPKAIETPFSAVNTSIDINENNSNITSLIALKPDKISYKVSLKMNPLGNLHTYDDFLLRESFVKVDADVEIPLSINVSNLRLTDTVEFTSASIKDVEKIEKGSFNFIVDNQFPFDAFTTIYLLDPSNKVIDSLTSADPIIAGVADANGRVVAKKHSVVKYPFNKAQINKIASASKLLFDVKFATPAQKFVKLFTDYNMDIKLVGDFIYNVDANEALD
jgi:hypothetical protein